MLARVTLTRRPTPRAGATRQVIGGPLASGLLLLDGRGGLFGWQWVFLVEGVATAAFGLVLLCALPRAPDTAWCLAPAERAAQVARRAAERDAAERKDPSGGTTTRARPALACCRWMPSCRHVLRGPRACGVCALAVWGGRHVEPPHWPMMCHSFGP